MLLNKRIPIGYIFSLVKYKLLAVIILAGGLSYLDGHFENWGILFPIISSWLPGILGTMITLVLAFRMNQSYDRWWEARKIWGGIVNDSRSLIREVTFLKNKGANKELHTEFKTEVIELLVLWLHSLKTRLKGFPEDVYYAKAKSMNVPLGVNLPTSILFRIEELIGSAYENGMLNEFQQLRLTKTVNQLNDGMGKSERIKGTVFPKLYSDMIDFSIWFFVIVFPLAFRDLNHYVEFPIVTILSMIFIILEKLAIHLQDPFENRPTDVPLDSIVDVIEAFANEALGKGTKSLTKEDAKVFYTM